MSAPETTSNPDPRAQTPHKRPWGWIALSGLLAAAVVGLAIYAVGLDSDLDDANAKIASQQKQIDEAQGTGADVVAAAKSAYDDLSTKVGAAQQNAGQAVEQANQVLDQAEQAAADAQGTADELKAQADAAQANAETAATCARSFLSAFSGVFDAASLQEGIDAAVADLQDLQPQCASAIQEAGS
jgi:chromosome segregation ATPase